MGIHAVQVAKMLGARVIAVDVREEKLAAAQEAGADEVVHSQAVPLEEAVGRITDGQGVDVVLDFAGTAFRGWTR